MKNLKRVFLLLALVFIASKILYSDFDLSQNKSLNATAVVATK